MLSGCLFCICVAYGQFQQDNPWREIDGQTNDVKINGVWFGGQVKDILSDGIRIQGSYGRLIYAQNNRTGQIGAFPTTAYNGDFFVTNFPTTVVSDQSVSGMAFNSGTYTYETVVGSSRTIPQLDYGIPCGVPPDLNAENEKQQMLDKEIEELKKSAVVQQLAMNATNGDRDAQFSLAIHYRDGIGCEANEQLAFFWFSNSASLGNLQASNELVELETTSNSTNSESH